MFNWSSSLVSMDNNWIVIDVDESKLDIVNRWAAFVRHFRRYQRRRRIFAQLGAFLKSRKALGVQCISTISEIVVKDGYLRLL